ncbi:MAG: hypothetical protein ABIH00_11135 [Armatimonadota bacterium]
MFKKFLALALLASFVFTSFAFAADTTSSETVTIKETVTTTVEETATKTQSEDKAFFKSDGPYVEPLYGMIVKLEGDTIVTNLGKTKDIQPGTKFYAYRVKTFIGVVEIERVEQWRSFAKQISLEPGQEFNRGDRLSDKELEFVGDLVYIKGTRVEVITTTSGDKFETEDVQYETKNPKIDFNKYKNSSIEDIFKKYTKVYTVKSKGKKRERTGAMQLNVPGVSDLDYPYPNYPYGGGSLYNPYGVGVMDAMYGATWASLYFNPRTRTLFDYSFTDFWTAWPVYSSIAFTLYTRYTNAQQYEKMMGMARQTSISVTKWDEDLIYELAAYDAYKNAIYDENVVIKNAENVIKAKGLRDNLVFAVGIKSVEDGAVQFAPWDYHMYLVDSGGRRIKCEKYDASLDKGLSKGRETSGFVYFNKRYDTSKITILLEDIWGNNDKMTFKN